MGQLIRWQVIITFLGILFLGLYLSTIRTSLLLDEPATISSTFREGVVGKPQFLNPLLAVYNPVDQDITRLLFSSLLRDDGSGHLEPVLAQDWYISDDGLQYDFNLRQDVLWSDGEQLTSADVQFTIQLMQADDFPGDPTWQQLWQQVEVIALDDFTLRFVLQTPFPVFPYYATMGILPKHTFGNIDAQLLLTHPANLQPISAGPYKLLEATSRHALLTVNNDFWGQIPSIQAIEFKFYPDQAALQDALLNEQIDAAGTLSQTDLPAAQSTKNLQVFNAPLSRYTVLHLNHQAAAGDSLFQDPALRQALSYLLDRQKLIDNGLPGQAIAGFGPVVPWHKAYNPQVTYEFNIKSGLELLEEAGWIDHNNDGVRTRDGIQLQFTLLVGDNPAHKSIAEEIAVQWQAAQIGVRVEHVDEGLTERLTTGDYQTALLEAQLFGDPDLYPYWHASQAKNGPNFSQWNNPEASQLLDQIRTTFDLNERLTHYHQFQTIFSADQPAIILYYPVYTYLVRDNVENIQLTALTAPSDRFNTLNAWQFMATPTK